MANPRTSLEVRFWAKVERGEADACWLWLGVRRKDGMRYGICRVEGRRNGYAHRIAFELHNKRPPAPGLVVRHKCDNPICVNPAHLLEGTHGDNVHDAQERGRLATGERNAMSRPEVRAKLAGANNPMAKLSPDQVEAIRAAASQGVRKIELARTYGVCRSLITLIVKGQRWGGVL